IGGNGGNGGASGRVNASDGGSGGIVLMDGEPFVLGGDTVKIDFSNSTFDVRSDRRQVRINMMLRTSANSKEEFTLNIQRGVFRCRN
ncbi:MAG: hypothetical protein LBB56_00005, partial [Chitinispirillales bacterium]|nr:hypothetical protein [Chitinispirillales bacterium]